MVRALCNVMLQIVRNLMSKIYWWQAMIIIIYLVNEIFSSLHVQAVVKI